MIKNFTFDLRTFHPMRVPIILIFSFLVLNAAYGQKDSVLKKYDFMYGVHAVPDHGFFNSPVIVSESSPLFQYPDPASLQKTSLRFPAIVEVLKQGFDVKNQMQWYQVVYRRDTGYIRGADISTVSCHTYESHDWYLIALRNKANKDRTPYITLYRYNDSAGKTIDSLDINASYYESEVSMMEIENTGLENVEKLFRISIAGESCGIGTAEYYAVLCHGKLDSLTATFCEGEIGEDCSTVYLPLAFEHGKIWIAERGDVKNIFNQSTGKLNVYRKSAKLKVPDNELVVIKRHVETAVFKDGNYLENEDGSYKMASKKDITTLYRWNGRKLVRIKQ